MWKQFLSPKAYQFVAMQGCSRILFQIPRHQSAIAHAIRTTLISSSPLITVASLRIPSTTSTAFLIDSRLLSTALHLRPTWLPPPHSSTSPQKTSAVRNILFPNTRAKWSWLLTPPPNAASLLNSPGSRTYGRRYLRNTPTNSSLSGFHVTNSVVRTRDRTTRSKNSARSIMVLHSPS